MRTIEDTFKNAEFLQPKVYNRYKLGERTELKEMFIKAFKYYDKTIVEYKHLPAYDEIIDWMVDTKGKGLILMGECGLGKSTILKFVIPSIFHTTRNKVLKCVPAKELGQIDRNEKPFILIDDLGTENIKIDFGTRIDAIADAISYAEDSSKTLLTSTNLTPKQLQSKYDERTLDRLRRCKVVRFDGESLRAKQIL
jgi:DNA replication protein DnaC